MIPRLRPIAEEGIAIVGMLLLFTVKINLIGIAGESAGLRIDDLLLFFIGALIVSSFLIGAGTVASRMEWAALCVFAFFFASNAINLLFFSRSQPLYSFRFAEYFLFFYVGIYFARRHSIRRLCWWLLGANAVAMVLQELGLIGGFSSEGFRSTTSERVIGLTGGPWEVGTIINFLYAILLRRENTRSANFFNVGLFLFTFTLLILTGARMPIVAHICVSLLYLVRRSRRPALIAISAAAFTVPLIAVLVLVPNPLSKRSENLFSAGNIQALQSVYAHVTPSSNASSIPWADHPVEEVGETAGGVDLSWAYRIIKWSYTFKLWSASPITWLIGIGPGTCGVALDGAWLRLLAETGFIGLILFIMLLRRIASINQLTSDMVVALSINMAMVDIHLAYKAMSFFLFAAGYFFLKPKSEKTRSPSSPSPVVWLTSPKHVPIPL